MNCAQVREQLVDFLYEELTPDLRAAFVEHLHGCPGCSAEVASHQKALGQARAALAGPLLQEPPARVHAAVLAAAKAEAAAAKRDAQRRGERAPRVGGDGAIRESPLRPPEPERGRVWEPNGRDESRPYRGSRDKNEPGFFARFWRTPWLLPAFGAVSVATAVFLVKVLKNPEGLPGQTARPVDELAVPAAARPPVAPVPAEQAGPAPADKPPLEGITRRQPPERAKARARAARTAGKAEARVELGAGAPTSGASTRFAEPPPPRPAAKASRSIDDMLGSVGRRPVPAPAASEAAKPAAEKKTRAARDEDTPLWKASPAYAPPGAPAPAAAPAAPPSPSQVMRSKRAETEAEEAPLAATDDRGYDAKETTAKDKGGPSLDESIKKADRLFAAQSWTAAAEAYRDLLRRFPSHKDAPRWRDRIGQSLFAEENRRANEAKAGKASKAKSSSDVLNGRK